MGNGRHHPSFSLPVFREFTGKMQFCIDGMEHGVTDRGTVKRGEVIAVKSKRYAEGLADSGQFAHVAADTPVGATAPVADEDFGDIADEVNDVR